jgi:hypothetical protein
MILPISLSEVARITSVSLGHPAMHDFIKEVLKRQKVIPNGSCLPQGYELPPA